MYKEIGKVVEVFIPHQYKDGKLLDIMDRTNIGFKIMTDNGLMEVIQKQDEYNCKIMRNDLVMITKQTINNKEFIDIEIYGCDENSE